MKAFSGKDYRSRGIILNSLGFKTYRAYLESDLWKKVRARVFEVKGRRCFLCGEFASQAHHTRYHANDLTGKRLKYIHPVCGRCHEGVEFDGEIKRTLSQAKRQTQRIRRERIKTMSLVNLILNYSSESK